MLLRSCSDVAKELLGAAQEPWELTPKQAPVLSGPTWKKSRVHIDFCLVDVAGSRSIVPST